MAKSNRFILNNALTGMLYLVYPLYSKKREANYAASSLHSGGWHCVWAGQRHSRRERRHDGRRVRPLRASYRSGGQSAHEVAQGAALHPCVRPGRGHRHTGLRQADEVDTGQLSHRGQRLLHRHHTGQHPHAGQADIQAGKEVACESCQHTAHADHLRHHDPHGADRYQRRQGGRHRGAGDAL